MRRYLSQSPSAVSTIGEACLAMVNRVVGAAPRYYSIGPIPAGLEAPIGRPGGAGLALRGGLVSPLVNGRAEAHGSKPRSSTFAASVAERQSRRVVFADLARGASRRGRLSRSVSRPRVEVGYGRVLRPVRASQRKGLGSEARKVMQEKPNEAVTALGQRRGHAELLLNATASLKGIAPPGFLFEQKDRGGGHGLDPRGLATRYGFSPPTARGLHGSGANAQVFARTAFTPMDWPSPMASRRRDGRTESEGAASFASRTELSGRRGGDTPSFPSNASHPDRADYRRLVAQVSAHQARLLAQPTGTSGFDPTYALLNTNIGLVL